VIDARRCNVHDLSHCRGPSATIRVGKLPAGIAIDEPTDTVYVTSVGDDSVSVFNAATCDATNTSGCGQKLARVPVGLQPVGLFDASANHTVYVANQGAPALGGDPGNSTTVSMIDSATCNATDLSACPTAPPATVKVGGTPNSVSVALAATHATQRAAGRCRPVRRSATTRPKSPSTPPRQPPTSKTAKASPSFH
jgi:hypothetical protein